MMAARKCFALLLALLSCSCGTVKFYTQALSGQLEIWNKSRANAAVLADSGVATHVKERLRLIEELRAFAARELQLPTKSFGRYCDLKRPYVVWVVFAAPEFSVEAKEWWYPLVGRLKYRGFFNEKDALAEARKLRARGLDVFTGGVEAYSTLGYFADPVLNTFLHRDESELAELVFHELTHAKVFLPGDTDFNEAFATANAQDGVRRWLRARGETSALRRYEASLHAQQRNIGLILAARSQLQSIYACPCHNHDAMRRAKQRVFEEMLRKAGSQQPRTRIRSATGAASTWNNARLNTAATYYTLVPDFARLLAKHHGDLAAFHAAVAAMRHHSTDERRRLLHSPGN